MPRLENWYLSQRPTSPYQAPEVAPYCVVGRIYNDPRFNDGEIITTGTIKNAFGKGFNTSRTNYELGQPDPQWLEWLESEGRVYIPENPLGVFSSQWSQNG